MKRHIGFYRRRLAGLLCILSLLAATVLPAAAKETAVPAPEQEVMNILLIGRDAPAGTDHSRSDSILLCTFHADSNTLTMTSVLRDLYVPIPGHRSNRINAAYALGGTKLLKQTVEANFGVTADGSITVDFTRFPKLIDLLGGVTLELRADEAAAINDSIAGNLTEGENLLTGAQALAYVRIRKLDKGGDFSRTNRQQKLLTALLDAYRSASLPQILRLLKETLSIVETDMDTGEILRSARQLVPILSRLQVKHQHIPAEGTYEYRTVRGMSVLSADLEAARNLLQQTVNPPAEKTDAPAIRLLCF